MTNDREMEGPKWRCHSATDVSYIRQICLAGALMLGTTLSTSQLRPSGRDRQHTVGRLSVLQPVVRVSSLVSHHSAEVPTV